MKKEIIIIALIFDEGEGSEKVTEFFETEYLTQAVKLMEEKYSSMYIEYLYVFDNTLNLLPRVKILLNVK